MRHDEICKTEAVSQPSTVCHASSPSTFGIQASILKRRSFTSLNRISTSIYRRSFRFGEVMKESFTEFVTRTRHNRATALLRDESKCSVTEIAAQVGYRNLQADEVCGVRRIGYPGHIRVSCGAAKCTVQLEYGCRAVSCYDVFQRRLDSPYLLIKSLGFIDSRRSLIIPALISTYSLLILRNFFMSIPEELEDSAKIDGANELRILFTIVMPLSKPGLNISNRG
ncbi:helix-turn-helix domain-containing protein [Paenibacillus chartarius]|uniref:Helix-turn-helix domain-containing protein n=1 Tax=Paenibacillus chartarius TaxID=747481 RepID=A0ABV6DLU9_9BACL